MSIKGFCTLGLLITSAHIHASGDDLFDLSLRQLMNMPITGTTLTTETLSSSPAAITVFNSDFIQSLGVEYLHELLDYVPGVQTQRTADSNFSYGFSFRGRRNGGQSKEVLLLLDGQVLNDPRTGAANGSVRLMTLDNIQRLEVIRGPGSALYGTGAFSGVINIISKKNVDAVAFKLGHLDKQGASVNTSRQFNAFEVDTYIHYQQDKGDQYQVVDSFNDGNVQTKDPRSLLEIRAKLSGEKTHFAFYAQQMQGDDFYSLGRISNDFNKNIYRHYGTSIKQDFKLTENSHSYFELDYRYAQANIDTQITAAGDLFAISNPQSNDPVFIKANIRSEGYRAKFHNDFQLKENLSFQWGLDWHRNSELTSEAKNNFNTGQLYDGVTPVEYYGDFSQKTVSQVESDKDMVGAYAQSIWHLSPLHQLSFGLRYDNSDSVSSHWSPRVGWVISVDENNVIKLLYGEAFRAASLNEMANPESPIIKGNPDLNHEVIKTYDVIYQHIQSQFNFQVGGYYNQYTDPINIQLNENSIREYTSGNDSDGYGLEFEGNWNAQKYTWVRLTLSELLSTPDNFFIQSKSTASLMLSYVKNAIGWNLSTVYHGAREIQINTDDFEHIPSSWQANFKLSYNVNKNWSNNILIKNMSNNQFASATQEEGLSEGVPARGRELIYSLKYLF
ncbi:MAG: TonB-dependent receptor [Bermanella sp.]